MMRRLGEYILRGRIQAIGFTSLFTVVALIVPVLTYFFSGIVPALVTLRQGPLPGLQVIAGSLLLTTVVALPASVSPFLMLMLALGIWAPCWFCASVLRLTEDQGKMLLAAGLCGVIYILLSHMLIDDVAQWWKAVLEAWIEALPAESQLKYGESLVGMSPWMNAAVSAGLVISLVGTLLSARWWQAFMFQPGGFGREFQALHLPRILTLVPAAIVVYLVTAGRVEMTSPVLEALVLVIFLYVFQGVALVHRMVAAGRLARPWLIAMYILLALVPQAVLFLACMGMVDSWMHKTVIPGAHDKS